MDSNDYDHVRNMTIMFFLDLLIGKGQPRKLHDLSCQFGTKGFTKEMRQIAGGSKAGLKKFLSQYPFLFTIEEDQVHVTHMTNLSSTQDKRDYTKEACEYFKAKLEQYGNAEVPIPNLFGHRSQASPEVRHVSGQHIREFKEFLSRSSDIFIVNDDYVVLKDVWEKVGDDGKQVKIKRIAEDVSMDPYLMQQLVNNLENLVLNLSRTDGIGLDELLDYMKAGGNEMYFRIINNTKDLTTLLKMNSRSFTVSSNRVSLTNEREKTLRNIIQPRIPLTPPRSDSPSPLSSPSRISSVSSLQQRMRTEIMKAIADNANIMYKNGTNSDVMVLRQTCVVTKTKECEEIINMLLKNYEIVGIDCQGVNMISSGSITLVTISILGANGSPPKIYIFDVFCNPDLMINGLKKLFESQNVIKVFHDCRSDCATLWWQFGIAVVNVFDTQVGHSVIQQQTMGKPVYKSKFVSLISLCELYIGLNNKKDLKKRHDPKYWSLRPLTEEMIYLAANDVFYLLDIYMNMSKAIREEYTSLLDELNKEAIMSGIKPDQVKASKKLRKIDMEIADLKQKLYNNEAKSIVLSNREIRLLRFINVTDDIRSKIEGSQKVAKKLERLAKKNIVGKGNQEKDCNISSESDDNESDGEKNHYEYEDYGSLGSNQSHELINGNNIFSSPDSIISNRSCCSCSCHNIEEKQSKILPSFVHSSTQTWSTGDIAITKVFFEKDSNTDG